MDKRKDFFRTKPFDHAILEKLAPSSDFFGPHLVNLSVIVQGDTGWCWRSLGSKSKVTWVKVSLRLMMVAGGFTSTSVCIFFKFIKVSYDFMVTITITCLPSEFMQITSTSNLHMLIRLLWPYNGIMTILGIYISWILYKSKNISWLSCTSKNYTLTLCFSFPFDTGDICIDVTRS